MNRWIAGDGCHHSPPQFCTVYNFVGGANPALDPRRLLVANPPRWDPNRRVQLLDDVFHGAPIGAVWIAHHPDLGDEHLVLDGAERLATLLWAFAPGGPELLIGDGAPVVRVAPSGDAVLAKDDPWIPLGGPASSQRRSWEQAFFPDWRDHRSGWDDWATRFGAFCGIGITHVASRAPTIKVLADLYNRAHRDRAPLDAEDLGLQPLPGALGPNREPLLQSWPPYQGPPRRPLRLEPGGRMPG